MKNNKPIDSLFKAFDVLTMKSKLTFGKYKRKTLEFVVENDPDYVIWLVDNTNHVFDKKVVLAAGQKVLMKLAASEDFDLGAETTEFELSLEDTF